QLLDATGAVLASSTLSGTSVERIAQTLNAGTYYVRVYPYLSASTNYTLSLSATAVPPDGAGDTLAAARDTGALPATQSFKDFVGGSDANDYYRFSLGATSNFSLSLSGLGADAGVQLLDASGAVLASSTLSGTSVERIARTLGAGTYYVRV